MCKLYGRFELQQGDFNLNVDVQIPGIGITAIFGKSGSGKTTLLRCIAGLERAQNGFLKVNNHFFYPLINVPWVMATVAHLAHCNKLLSMK